MAANLPTGGEPLTEKVGSSATLRSITSLDFGEITIEDQTIRSIYLRKQNVVQLLLHFRAPNQPAKTPIGGVFWISKYARFRIQKIKLPSIGY